MENKIEPNKKNREQYSKEYWEKHLSWTKQNI